MKQNISTGMLATLNALSLRYESRIPSGSICSPCGGTGFRDSAYVDRCPCCDNGIVRAYVPSASKSDSLELAVAAFERAYNASRK